MLYTYTALFTDPCWEMGIVTASEAYQWARAHAPPTPVDDSSDLKLGIPVGRNVSLAQLQVKWGGRLMGAFRCYHTIGNSASCLDELCAFQFTYSLDPEKNEYAGISTVPSGLFSTL